VASNAVLDRAFGKPKAMNEASLEASRTTVDTSKLIAEQKQLLLVLDVPLGGGAGGGCRVTRHAMTAPLECACCGTPARWFASHTVRDTRDRGGGAAQSRPLGAAKKMRGDRKSLALPAMACGAQFGIQPIRLLRSRAGCVTWPAFETQSIR
jgi:hypothetical protein